MSKTAVKNLYGINSCVEGFISNFSFKNTKDEIVKNSYNLYNEIAILIKATNKLNNACPEWETLNKENQSLILENIIDFISELNKFFDKNSLNVYCFTDKIEKIDSLEGGNIKEQIGKYSERYNTDIISTLGLLFNEINEQNSKRPKNGRFLRIILFTDSNYHQIDVQQLENIIKAFSSSNKNYESAVLNIISLEECENIKTLKSDSLYKKICDNLNYDDSIELNNNEINEVFSIIKNKEKRLIDQYKKYYSETSKILNKDELKDFINLFDEKYSEIQDLYDALLNKYDKIMEIEDSDKKKKIEDEIRNEVIELNLINRIVGKVKNNIQDNESNKINDWKGEADKVISDFKNEINSLENNCKDVKNSDYWEKKFQFIKNQIDNLNNFKKKVIEYQNFLDYVGGEIKGLSENITSSPQ